MKAQVEVLENIRLVGFRLPPVYIRIFRLMKIFTFSFIGIYGIL